MAVFGQGINPALGRIDYTPYAQGAVAGAQGIAQGIAALGQGAAQGVQNYLKRKEEKQQEEAAVSTIGGILKRNPELASQLNLQPDAAGNFDQGALKAAIKGAGGPANTLKLASTLEELGVARQARQQQEQAASYAAMLRQGGGQVPSPVSNQALAQFSPQARVAGEAAFLATEQARANLGKTQADTAEARARAISLATPKAALGYDTFEAANKELTRLTKAGAFGEDTVGTVKFDNGRFVIESSLKLPRQVADPEAAERIRLSGKLMDADIASGEQARRLIPQTNSMISMLEGGLETGKLAPAKARFLAYAKAAGFDVDEAQLGKAEQFQAYATQQILGFISQTKGAVSNKENELFALMGPGFDRTPEGNKLLLRAIQERQKLDAAIGDNALRAIEEGWSQAKTAQERRKLIEAYDAKLPDPKSLGVKPASAPSAPVQPGSPTRRTYNPATGQLN
jgi:hypothetical protein